MVPSAAGRHPTLVVLMAFLRLGLTSFGGPIAHLGYLRDEFVLRRRWITDTAYVDLVTMCQFLPGPASSQVGMGIGLVRAGLPGALAAWVGFTVPSAVAMILVASGLTSWGTSVAPELLLGMKIATVAVVAQAVWGMSRSLCRTLPTRALALAAAAVTVAWTDMWVQVAAMTACGLIACLSFATADPQDDGALRVDLPRRMAIVALVLFAVLLVLLPVAASVSPSATLARIDVFYRAGSLVFGGGHVVLPVLQASTVEPGWISTEAFLAGYGAAQMVPGPLFTFAAYIGAASTMALTGWVGGVVCLIAVFAPSFLLVVGALPFWARLRHNRTAQAALIGVNAAVVGLLVAALYRPVMTAALHGPVDAILAAAALAALSWGRVPPYAVVPACAFVRWLIG